MHMRRFLCKFANVVRLADSTSSDEVSINVQPSSTRTLREPRSGPLSPVPDRRAVDLLSFESNYERGLSGPVEKLLCRCMCRWYLWYTKSYGGLRTGGQTSPKFDSIDNIWWSGGRADKISNKLAGDIACLGGSMVEHQPRLLGSRVRFPAGAFAIFSVSAKASLPISLSLSPFPFSFPSSSFPFLFLSLSFSLRPFVCAKKNASSHLSNIWLMAIAVVRDLRCAVAPFRV